MQTYRYVNMMLWVCTFSTFMQMLIYTIIRVLYHTNERDLSTNFRNTIVKSIENIVMVKKKLPSIVAMKNWDITVGIRALGLDLEDR